MGKFYSTKESANFIGVSVRTFKRLRQKGIVTPDKKGANNSVFYSEEQLLKLPRVVTSHAISGDIQVVSSGVNFSSGDNQVVSSSDKNDIVTAQVVTQAVPNLPSSDNQAVTSRDKIEFDTTSSSDMSPLVNNVSPLENKKSAGTAENSQNENNTNHGYSQDNYNLDEQIAAVKRIDPQELLIRGVLTSARNDGIICLCGNGAGNDGTGVKPFLNNHNVWTYHCFKCAQTYTNINYLAQHFHLDPRSDFVEIIKKSCYLFNIPLPQTVSDEQTQKDYGKFYYFAQRNLVGWLKSVGDSWRAFTLDTLQHFNCGFVNGRVIIPYNNYHYLARAVENGVDKPKQHHGKKSIFNVRAVPLNFPTLIFEGEIDAMSVWQASGGNIPAIAVGGAAEYKMLVRELNKIYGNSEIKPMFIVLFDNDEKDGKNVGQDFAKKAVSALLRAGYPAVNRIMTDEKNVDANDILQRDGNKTLADIIQNIVKNSMQELRDLQENISDYRVDEAVSEKIPADDVGTPIQDVPENLRLTDEQKAFLYTGEGFDLDNARRLAFLFQNEVRFITDLHQWAKFYDGLWHIESGQNSDIFPLVSKMADILKANARTKEERGRAFPFKSHKKFSPIVSTMKAVDSILITQKDLNTHKNLLNVKNGVVDLQTGTLHPHNPALFFTQITNAAYFPNQHSDLVEKFLSDILPDEPTRAALLRFLGYSITGSCQEEKALFINGSGGNGKGTLTKLVMTCLGDFAISFPIEGILESGRFSDANAATPAFNSLLFNRLAISEEIPAGKKLNAAKFKLLTGGDPLPIRQLFKEMTVIKDPTHTMIFSGNHLPELEDAHDPGILRRLLNINFSQSFTGDKCDETLKLRLLAPDSLNYFLTLLVKNSVEWYKSGLIVSDDMKKARQDYLDSQDFISDFISEHCKRDPQASIPRSDFLKRLRKECDAAVSLSDRTLTSAITKIDGVYYRRGSGGIRKFYGIAWIEQPTVYQNDIFEGSEIVSSEDFPF